MTAITIDKELLEQVVNKLLTCWPKSDPLVNELRAALAAPATAPEPVAWLAHYVGRSGVEQEYVSTDKTLADENDASGKARPLYLHPPATAPAWHDAPTVPGLWVVKTIVGPEAHNIEPHDINVGGNRQSGGGTPEDCPVDRQVGGG